MHGCWLYFGLLRPTSFFMFFITDTHTRLPAFLLFWANYVRPVPKPFQGGLLIQNKCFTSWRFFGCRGPDCCPHRRGPCRLGLFEPLIHAHTSDRPKKQTDAVYITP